MFTLCYIILYIWIKMMDLLLCNFLPAYLVTYEGCFVHLVKIIKGFCPPKQKWGGRGEGGGGATVQWCFIYRSFLYTYLFFCVMLLLAEPPRLPETLPVMLTGVLPEVGVPCIDVDLQPQYFLINTNILLLVLYLPEVLLISSKTKLHAVKNRQYVSF